MKAPQTYFVEMIILTRMFIHLENQLNMIYVQL